MSIDLFEYDIGPVPPRSSRAAAAVDSVLGGALDLEVALRCLRARSTLMVPPPTQHDHLCLFATTSDADALPPLETTSRCDQLVLCAFTM